MSLHDKAQHALSDGIPQTPRSDCSGEFKKLDVSTSSTGEKDSAWNGIATSYLYDEDVLGPQPSECNRLDSTSRKEGSRKGRNLGDDPKDLINSTINYMGRVLVRCLIKDLTSSDLGLADNHNTGTNSNSSTSSDISPA